MDWTRELDTARAAVALAGRYVLAEYAKFVPIPNAPASISTHVDREAQEIILRHLRSAFPADGLVAEEATPTLADAPANAPRTWIVDPIDGTRAFIEGREDWCVAAALAIHGRPVLAAVYCPRLEEFYAATAGQGASLNGKALTIPDSDTLAGARIAGNRKALSGLAHLGIAEGHSNALPLQLRLAHVAAGRLDGAVSIGRRHDWDLAAGELLVIEAGGAVSSSSGEGLIYNRAEPWQQGLVAAGAKRHAALIDALRTT